MAIKDIATFLQRDNQAFTTEYSKYKKNYPAEADLKPLSQDHDRLVQYLLLLANESSAEISKRYPAWKKIDQKLTAYVRLDEDEKKIKTADDRKPVRMVVPTSFAILDTLMTYDTAAFLRSPLVPLEAIGPEDTIGVMMMQSVLNQNLQRSRAALEMFTMLRDYKVYGFGVGGSGWKREYVNRTIRSKSLWNRLTGGKIFTGAAIERVKKFEGNTLTALDVYNVLPDPNFPVQYVQRGSSFGWLETRSIMDLLNTERDNDEYFNVEYVKNSWVGSSSFKRYKNQETGRYDFTGQPSESSRYVLNKSVDLLNYYVKLIPADFGLGKETYPELWLFTLAGDRVIVRAKRVDNNHGMIPVGVVAPTSDGHTIYPTSIMEITYPMQEAIDWMWASHVGNVRKAVHNMLVVDPQIINMNDVTDTTWGMIARVRPSHWGRGVKDGIMQLPVSDVTARHPADMSFMMNIVQRASAATDQAQGFQERSGERVSATEASGTRNSQLSRLEMRAFLAGMQGFNDLGYQYMSDVNQYLDSETYVKITGEMEMVLREEYGIPPESDYLRVDPTALDINADVLVKDGTIPDMDMAQAWSVLMQEARTNPELVQKLDSVRLWMHMARKMGAKNPEAFLRRTSMRAEQPGENLEQAAQQGNAVPVEEYANENGRF